MQEIELKFLIPKARIKTLLRQVKVKSSQTTQLAAHYYDTPKQTLAKAGIGLRIRLEGDQWVQTIKAGGDGIAARLEHNTVLDFKQVQTMIDDNKLFPDLRIYQDTFIAPALIDFKLNKLAKNLTRQYVTDVERVTRIVEEDNSSIEIAYDYGEIIHGSNTTLRYPIHEIEFEMVSGELSFLFATAKVWCKRYKLCLSTVTKAELGGLLVKEQAYSRAVRATLNQLNVSQASSMSEFIRAIVHNCLLQILPNSSAIIAGSLHHEHVLQLCIGIQRLHCALIAFERFSDQLNSRWLPILKQTEQRLGDYRETVYLASTIQPKLEPFGAPRVDWSAELASLTVTPTNAVQANDFQLTLLELIEFTMSDACNEPQAKMLAIDILPKILAKKHSKLLKAEHKLANLKDNDFLNNELTNNNLSNNVKADVVKAGNDMDQKDAQNISQYDAQHRICQHLKELRYISEFAAPLYGDKKHATAKSKHWLKRLTKAQQALDKQREHRRYQHRYQNKSLTDTKALYGAGWFTALTKSDLQRCQKCLDKVRDSSVFW